MKVTVAAVEKLMTEYPELNDAGLLFVRKSKNQSDDDYRERNEDVRKRLTGAGCLAEIDKCATWINQNISPIQGFNTKHTSYGLKHIAEKECRYISNGSFIVAALLCGYKCSIQRNPHFNMSERSIKLARKKIE